MAHEFDDWLDEREDESPRRDEQTDRAKIDLLERIQASDRVYYVQQLQVLYEREYFHWITGRALRELIEERMLNAVWEELSPGVRIKNTLKYIDDHELETKLEICSVLGLRPLFVVRIMPKTWAWPRVIRRGGYVMMLGEQFYPLGAEEFADQVREQLLLPVVCRRRLEDGHVERFRRWHIRYLQQNRQGFGVALGAESVVVSEGNSQGD